jgi:uridine kinase
MNFISKFAYKRKIFAMLRRTRQIQRLTGVSTIADLNATIKSEHFNSIMDFSENRYHAQGQEIVGRILHNPGRIRLITIAGPSSSGKTTFCFRLRDALKDAGIRSMSLSMDNYFQNRDKTPVDENGDHDFESFETLDHALLSSDLAKLVSGKSVDIPVFNFKTGLREYHEKPVSLEPGEIIIMEGIHGLNRRATIGVPRGNIYRVYLTAMIQLKDPSGAFIHTTDNRFIRRLVRDSQFRGYDAEETIRRWPSVIRGEKRNIFPFQDNADYVFNSSLLYELPVLKKFAFELLVEINRRKDVFWEARKLLSLLNYFDFAPQESIEAIPAKSALREFIGGSGYKY